MSLWIFAFILGTFIAAYFVFLSFPRHGHECWANWNANFGVYSTLFRSNPVLQLDIRNHYVLEPLFLWYNRR